MKPIGRLSVRLGAQPATAPLIGKQMHEAQLRHQDTAKAARVFTEFQYDTQKLSNVRRVVAKAEYLDKARTRASWSLRWPPTHGQRSSCTRLLARGEMENRIKEQMCLFADRLSTYEMNNQLRLYFSALAYTLVEALRRLALKGTEWAQSQVDTIRLKLFKIGTLVRISTRRIVLQ